MGTKAIEALVRLVASWQNWAESRSWYLDELVPRIIEDGADAGRDDAERQQISIVRELLNDAEWRDLRRHLAVVEVSAARVREARDNRKRIERALADTLSPSERHGRTEFRQRRMQHQARQSILRQLYGVFRSDFLGARDWLRANDPDGLIDEDCFSAAAAAYVTLWCKANLVDYAPDGEQARAIAAVTRHTLVAARAGSGKTATMVARAAFLVRACGVDPAQILMLAFNNSAASAMREQVEGFLGDQHAPHVMTFDALASRLLFQPRENVIKGEEASNFVRRITNELVRDPDVRPQFRAFMLSYFRRDWFGTEPSDDQHRLRYETLKREVVKSYGEKLIANTLFENGYNYRYERDVRWDRPGDRPYKPDFSIYLDGEPRVAIEYFGMAGRAAYDEASKWKRDYWARRPEIAFREYYPRDVAAPGFAQRLIDELTEAGAPPTLRSEGEIWKQVRTHALDVFTEVGGRVIERARQRGWTGAQLQEAWNKRRFSDADLDCFISISSMLLDRYQKRLADHGKEKQDFAGVMWRAVGEVKSGKTTFGRNGQTDGDLRDLRHIVVDEFQDFSPRFFALLQQVLAVAPSARVMAVGDDWQAINGFAGSTVEYFEDFETFFPDADRLRMTTNRRSTKQLVDLGNSIMDGPGEPARALPGSSSGTIRAFHIEEFKPGPGETATLGKDDRLTPPLLRLIHDHHSHGRSVAVLVRKWTKTSVTMNGKKHTFSDLEPPSDSGLDKRSNRPSRPRAYGEWVREILRIDDPSKVRFSTVHRFKGEEADAVILVDVTAWNYPLIHPTWIFHQVFGDTIQTLTDAERRLFYVAASRAKTHLDVITTQRDPSPFWATTEPSPPSDRRKVRPFMPPDPWEMASAASERTTLHRDLLPVVPPDPWATASTAPQWTTQTRWEALPEAPLSDQIHRSPDKPRMGRIT